MNQTFRNILIIAGVLLAVFVIWYFINIVAYILISAVLSLIGRPIVEFLGKIRIKQVKIPKSLRALITLLTIWVVFIAFFIFIIPIVTNEMENLSKIDGQSVLVSLKEPINYIEGKIDQYSVDSGERFVIEDFVSQKLVSYFNVSFITTFFGNLAGTLGSLFIALFSVTFITFFFLRDENLFAESLLSLVPDKHVDAFRHAMTSSRILLRRYFIGILAQLTGIFIMVSSGLKIVGFEFSHCVLIGLLAAILNIIPYLGPVLGASMGVLIGIATHLDNDFYTEVLPQTGWLLLVFIIVQLTDNFIFQPFIFSKSVKAHPLEIFLLILIAGSLAGIPGMILAIPCYTILRVFAKEFFNKFKVVKKLTQKIT